MSRPTLLCADGSLFSTNSLRSGIELLGEDRDYIVAMVVETPDVGRFVATGLAGGVMSAQEIDYQLGETRKAAEALVNDVAASLGLAQCPTMIVEGEAGPQICGLAAELDAEAVVLGSRGHGGLLRAVLGSVSDHVVRHAPCTVVVARGET